jgi:hypothetical protein
LPKELAFVGACAEGGFGAKQQDKPFYVWTDSAGIRHISDKPTKRDNNAPISIVGAYPPAQFISRFISAPMSARFQDKLSQGLAKEFAQILDVTTVREVALNLGFFTQQVKFQQYKKHVAPTRSRFYLHATNEMIILLTDESQA